MDRLHEVHNIEWQTSYRTCVVWDACGPEEGRFNVWNQTFTDGDMEKAALFHSLFLHVLEIVPPDFTRRDSSANGFIRTVSRIDRAFLNIPMAEARDFHCYSHVFENLVKRFIPSDHAAVRDEEHQYLPTHLALADFKTILEKAKRQTVRELSRKT